MNNKNSDDMLKEQKIIHRLDTLYQVLQSIVEINQHDSLTVSWSNDALTDLINLYKLIKDDCPYTYF